MDRRDRLFGSRLSVQFSYVPSKLAFLFLGQLGMVSIRLLGRAMETVPLPFEVEQIVARIFGAID